MFEDNMRIDEETINNIIKEKNLGYCNYTAQTKAIRKLAIKYFGSDRVAMMNDGDIEHYFRVEKKMIPMVISCGAGYDEIIFLVPISDLTKYDCLRR